MVARNNGLAADDQATIGGQPTQPLGSQIQIGRDFFRPHSEFPGDIEAARLIAASLPADADFCEPFGRVREALAETLGIGSGAA